METKNNGRALHRGTVEFVNGPVIKAAGMRDFGMREVVHVGPKKLMGEIIKMDGDNATIQVYEDTDGLKIYEDVAGTGEPLSIELGPGLIGSFFDGIGRPLDALLEHEGMYISPGTTVNMINRDKIWDVTPTAKVGDMVAGGMVLATIQETPLLVHKIMVPPGLEGEVTWITPSGKHSAGSDAARIKDAFGREITIPIIQRWPVRTPRPYRERLLPNEPFVTGQRVIDGLFPLAKGGTACIPGGFGTGKTVTQHQLAKWGDAQVVIYIGCGERGNEMTDVLEQFPVLEDPRSGRPLMERTILIANTSNMPVAAREASIYTGITIAEYFRDMGYDVAIMADSTSRWAEALRELSGRLEEIPAEEGFPAYLPSRLAEFYERAGRVVTIGGENGSVSIIGAVSPPGGDFTEPVTRHTKRFIRCFWGLDKNLANARHYPRHLVDGLLQRVRRRGRRLVLRQRRPALGRGARRGAQHPRRGQQDTAGHQARRRRRPSRRPEARRLHGLPHQERIPAAELIHGGLILAAHQGVRDTLRHPRLLPQGSRPRP